MRVGVDPTAPGYVGRVRLVGFVRDQEDMEYLARTLDFDVNEWLRLAG